MTSRSRHAHARRHRDTRQRHIASVSFFSSLLLLVLILIKTTCPLISCDCVLRTITWCQSRGAFFLGTLVTSTNHSRSKMSSGFATPSLNWEIPDLPNAFRSFRQYCNLIFAGPYSAKREREKVTFLLLWTGRHGIDLHNSWTWNSQEDKHKLDAVWKKFSDHIEPKVNAYRARFQLSQLKQHSDEGVDNFIARCRVTAAKCKFADIVEMNTRLIEQLITGTQHDYGRGKLLERGDGLASLDEAMDIARTFETTKAHVAQ